MKLQKDLIRGQAGAINILKKITIFFLFIHLQSCVIDKADLRISILNLSKSKVYVGELYGCDSCTIQQDFKMHCSCRNCDPPMLPVLNSKDSIQLAGKFMSNRIKIYSINADSLDEYCNQSYKGNIVNKPWVKILSGNVDMDNKTCTIVIK
jgi:hypothetical protein